jgi:hypothetical protein
VAWPGLRLLVLLVLLAHLVLLELASVQHTAAQHDTQAPSSLCASVTLGLSKAEHLAEKSMGCKWSGHAAGGNWLQIVPVLLALLLASVQCTGSGTARSELFLRSHTAEAHT